jgi:hypothetical protein
MTYTLRQFLTYTFMVVAVFVILTHAGGFAQGVKSLGQAYAGGVSALEGRA